MNILIPKYHAQSRNHTNKGHWTAYVQSKDEVVELIRAYCPHPAMFTVPVKVTIIARFKAKVHIDASNIDDKIYIDALRYAGVIKDDNFYHNPVVQKEVRIDTGSDQVEIIVEPYVCRE